MASQGGQVMHAILSSTLFSLLTSYSLHVRWNQNHSLDHKQEIVVHQFKSKRRYFIKPLS